MEHEPWGAVLTAVAGAFGLIRSYFRYRIKAVDHEHKKQSVIEDRRQELENTRHKHITTNLKSFESSVNLLRADAVDMRSRMGRMEETMVDHNRTMDRLTGEMHGLSGRVDASNALYKEILVKANEAKHPEKTGMNESATVYRKGNVK